MAQRRNVLILGRIGAGKSTLANKLIDPARILEGNSFMPSDCARSITNRKTSACTTLLKDQSNQHYILQVINAVGLFDCRSVGISNYMIMKRLSAFIKEKVPNGFNLVLFILRSGRFTEVDEWMFDLLTTGRLFSDELSSISALIITGCESFTEEKRKSIIANYVRSKPALAKFMKKGIYTVGFPDLDQLLPMPRRAVEEGVKSDQEHLRQLVYSCNENKHILKGEGRKEDERCNVS